MIPLEAQCFYKTAKGETREVTWTPGLLYCGHGFHEVVFNRAPEATELVLPPVLTKAPYRWRIRDGEWHTFDKPRCAGRP